MTSDSRSLRITRGECVGDQGVHVRGSIERSGRIIPVDCFFADDDVAGLSDRAIKRRALKFTLDEERAAGRDVQRRVEIPTFILALFTTVFICASADVFVPIPSCPASLAHGDSHPGFAEMPRWSEEKIVEWYGKPWAGDVRNQAEAFLVAVLSHDDRAICKAAIWLMIDDAVEADEPHLIAARQLLSEFTSDEIEAAIIRDAHLFEVDADILLGVLHEVLGQ